MPLLVLAAQEPELGLRRVAASALADIAKHSPELAQAVIDAGMAKRWNAKAPSLHCKPPHGCQALKRAQPGTRPACPCHALAILYPRTFPRQVDVPRAALLQTRRSAWCR